MRNEILVSFIVPVYNVQYYLQECVDSILNQCTDKCEIILVDDGSTDSSGTMCDEYEKSSTIIKTIHKVNGGLSSARNVGVENAKGRYVAFVDSDDRIADNSVSIIVGWAENSQVDICFMDAIKFFPDGSKFR